MKAKQWLVFILLGAIWGSSFMWIKIAIREVGPVTLVAYRASFGLLFGIAVVWIQRIQLPQTFKGWVPLLIIGLTNIAIPFFLISWGERVVESAVASILNATVPLFTLLIAHFVLRDDRITTPKMLGLLVGLTGIIILMSKDINAATGSILGQVAIIVAAVFYAISAIYVRKATRDMSAVLRGVGPLVSATAIMWPAASVFESPDAFPQQGITWIALLFMGVLGSGLAFMMANYLIHEIGPTRMTMVTYLFPLWGIVLGVTVLRELLTWQVLMGAGLIIASLIIANWEIKPRLILEKTAQ